MEPFLRFNVIGDAWRLYRRHAGIWSLTILLVLIGYSAISAMLLAVLGLNGPVGRGGFQLPLTPATGAIHYLVSTAVGAFFVGGLMRMASQQVRGRPPRIEDLFSVTDVGLELLLAAAFYSAATFVGDLLCVIPGVIVSGLLMFTIPFVVIARQPATAAVRLSWNALSPQWLTAGLFHFVLVVVSGSGILLCCIGLLLTAPLYSLSIAILYHEFVSAPAPPAGKPKPGDPFADF
jgi:uncharacterized membrane protein